MFTSFFNIAFTGKRTVVLITMLFLFACGQLQDAKTVAAELPVITLAKDSVPNFTLASFYSKSPALDSAVEKLYQSLTYRERAAQLIMDASSEVISAGLLFVRVGKLISDTAIGGLVFLKGDKSRFEKQIKIIDSISGSVTGPLRSCDCEPALFNQKMKGTPVVKLTRDLKTIEEVNAAAIQIATTIKSIGIDINFAPVADIGLNKKVINTRSFGTDSADILQKSVAFINATQSNGVAACVKHFPGHGAIEGDTHKGQVVINGRLSEVSTFKKIIEQSQPIFVMVGHISVKNNPSYNSGGLPSSVSPKIIAQLLKQEIGFTGIVITDAMNMGALEKIADVDWKAIQAGVDIILMPRDARKLNSRLLKAMQVNDAFSSQLETSVKKVLRLKICLGRVPST